MLARLQSTSRHSVAVMGQGQQETDKAVAIARLSHQHLQMVVAVFGEITERDANCGGRRGAGS